MSSLGPVDPALAFVLGVALGVVVAVLALAARSRDARPGGDAGPARNGRVDVTAVSSIPDGLGILGAVGGLAGIGIVRVGSDWTVDAANGRAHELLGRASGTLLGLTAIEAFADHRGEEAVRRAAASGEASAELAPHPATRSTLLARARKLEGGAVWVVLEDVSELRRLQRIRTEFIDNLSHELRTPLTNVRLLTESLTLEVDPLEMPERVRDSIRKIDVETHHLVEMVNELLDLSRIEQGTGRRRNEDVDLAAVVRGAVERIRLFADRSGVTLQVDIEDPLHVTGDDDRLAQMLLNLLHNSVKFSQPGGNVVVSAVQRHRDVVVAIRDDGAGIPKEDLERVFERFYKVDKARVRGRGGTGLGLAIARHIAESHGGRIWAESEEGSGSTFTVALPATPRARDA